MADIKQRKNRLKDDLELLEGSFENRINKFQNKVLGPFKPVPFIKKKPFQAVGVAIIAGLAVGLARKRKRKFSDQDQDYSVSDDLGFTSLLFDEVKRIAARRVASYISEFVEKKMSQDD